MKIANRSERLHVLPPKTVYPPEAKLVRPPGTQVSSWLLPDGSEAAPARIYPSLMLPPGVTEVDENVHDAAYFDLIQKKASLSFGTDLEFVTSSKTETEVKRKLKLIGQKDEAAAAFAEIETDPATLRRWLAEENGVKPPRKAVRDAIQKRLTALEK